MAKFPQLLTDKSEWEKICQQFMGKKWIPPKKGKTIQIESLGKIDKLMREKPNPTRRE